jgi:ribonuclease HII
MVRNRSPLVLPDKPNLVFEKQLWGGGYRAIAGLDEAGRGAWAGPVYAAAVVLPNDDRVCDVLAGVRDSKQMTARQRERYEECIKSVSISWAVGFATEGEIDAMGIVPATCMAMQRAIDSLVYPPNYLLIDYISLQDCTCPQLSLPNGDCQSLSIAAARCWPKPGGMPTWSYRTKYFQDMDLPAIKVTVPHSITRRLGNWGQRPSTAKPSGRLRS